MGEINDKVGMEVYQKGLDAYNELLTTMNKLQQENIQLKQDLNYYMNIVTLTKAIELVQEVYDKYLNESPSDPIAIAKRQAIIECISKLEVYLEDLDA